ncbi:T-cell surface glycoprotein CD8 alpha chain isoform X2 [Pogoniulus pusillus]|uniref:T-cell surface glycoprotein CD8 alpha chain isoform X2 n=1 Tax=Pogoniulus pusillus TaxID=488313 RepID=UPI0030B96B0E
MTSHPLQRATQPPEASQKDQLCSTTPHWGRPPSEKMPRARAPLLLLLGLVLCSCGTHGRVYSMVARLLGRDRGHLQVGQRLELECLPEKEDSGVFWMRRDRHGNLHFIVFISHINKLTFEGSQQSSQRFEAMKDSKSYRLVVKAFEPQDEGSYFCLMNSNQVLYFSSGLPAFFPVTTTRAPPTTQHGTTEKDPCPRTLDTDTSREELSFFCDIFIWAPLAGACLLLVIALVVTIVLCQQTRRRRCRCKRAAQGKPRVKPSRQP